MCKNTDCLYEVTRLLDALEVNKSAAPPDSSEVDMDSDSGSDSWSRQLGGFFKNTILSGGGDLSRADLHKIQFQRFFLDFFLTLLPL